MQIAPEHPPFTTIILLSWNGWRDTLVCLQSLTCLNYPRQTVIVVDNGSTDESVVRIRACEPAPMVLETGANLGFSGGNNYGIRRALADGADYVWLLNNDTRVDDPELLGNMVRIAERDPAVGGVGAILVRWDQPQQVQAWGGGEVNLWLGKGHEHTGPVPSRRLQYLTGASILLRRQALEQIGLLDEAFFLYWEDADLGFRLRRGGWKLAVAESCRIRHRSFASSPEGPQLAARFNRSAVRMYSKYARLPWVPLVLGTAARLAKRGMLGRWNQWPAILRAVAGSWRETAPIRRTRHQNAARRD